MGPEILLVGHEEKDREFVRLVSSKNVKLRHIEEAYAAEDLEEVDLSLRQWLVHGEDTAYAIHSAVRFGRLELLMEEYPRLNKAEIDIDTLISSGTLLLAAKYGQHDAVRLLIEACREAHRLGELINGHDCDCKPWTALHWACQNGDIRVVEVLLDSKEVSIDSPTGSELPWFTTPLHLAIKPSEEAQHRIMARPSECRNRVVLLERLLNSPEGTEMLNMKDWEGNTPLHLAVETRNVDLLEVLMKQRRLIATERNGKGKTPSALVWDQAHSNETRGSSAVKVIQKYLSELHDVREERVELTDARSRYYNAANNLLVGGALLASVTFSGILAMAVLPEQFLIEPLSSPTPAPSAQPYIHGRNVMKYKPYYIRAIDVFRGSNNLSFYFAIVTVMAAIRLIISNEKNIFLECEISRLRNSTVLISLSLTFSTIYAVVAFISCGLAKIPVAESGWGYVLSRWASGQSEAILKSTMLTTTMVGVVLIVPFIFIPLILDDLAILRAYLETKFDVWDSHHAKWALGRWRPLITLVVAILFFVATIFIMFMFIFGVGLLEDYIKLPPMDDSN